MSERLEDIAEAMVAPECVLGKEARTFAVSLEAPRLFLGLHTVNRIPKLQHISKSICFHLHCPACLF